MIDVYSYIARNGRNGMFYPYSEPYEPGWEAPLPQRRLSWEIYEKTQLALANFCVRGFWRDWDDDTEERLRKIRQSDEQMSQWSHGASIYSDVPEPIKTEAESNFNEMVMQIKRALIEHRGL